jgi:hypothetical protein
MGWWATVTNEIDKKSWNEHFTEMLDSLPKDYWISVIDCHI